MVFAVEMVASSWLVLVHGQYLNLKDSQWKGFETESRRTSVAIRLVAVRNVQVLSTTRKAYDLFEGELAGVIGMIMSREQQARSADGQYSSSS